jgi:hypothetical protein
VFEVGQKVLEGFAIALDVKRDFFRAMYQRPLVRTRLLYYPSQQPDPTGKQFGARRTPTGAPSRCSGRTMSAACRCAIEPGFGSTRPRSKALRGQHRRHADALVERPVRVDAAPRGE